MNNFPLSPKYIDFINTINVSAEFLEGTTAAGKTTVGAGVKFMRMVSRSKKKLHVIASKTTGVAEKNIINSEFGILSIHPKAIYKGNGDNSNKIPHIQFEDKIIYVLGYDDVSKWKLILGGQYGCVYIDEINTANIEFVREISTRNDYLLATLNPDDPNLPVYKEFINRSRPFKKYINDVPKEILEELKEPENPTWKYWFFSFYDNKSLTEEEIERKKNSAPIGTKLYKNKILGLRGKATGVVFNNFNEKEQVITKIKAKENYKYIQYTAGLDTAYSSNSEDTIAMIFCGITSEKELIVLDERVYNNKGLSTPIAPSDTVKNFIDFLERNREEWGLARNVFIDSADQATITELKKYKRVNPCVYIFNNAYKKVKIIDRINFQLNWIGKNKYYVVDTCKEHIKELNLYSWKENKDNEPEDRNDHTINACQYAWIPFRANIGEI